MADTGASDAHNLIRMGEDKRTPEEIMDHAQPGWRERQAVVQAQIDEIDRQRAAHEAAMNAPIQPEKAPAPPQVEESGWFNKKNAAIAIAVLLVLFLILA